MFKFFENLIDPFQPYVEDPSPPRQLWPWLKGYIRPFRGVFLVTGLLSVLIASGDIALIWYLGRLVDLMSTLSPHELVAAHGLEFAAVIAIVALLRPLISGAGAALLHNTILPNFGTMIRWRAHRHVLRQPVGWFESDFAGRIANRIMQAPPAAGDAVFQTFDAMSFGLVTVIGAGLLLADADPRLLVPLLIWLLLYGLLVRWTIRNAGPAARASADARSAVTGHVVDAYSNIHSVRLFAHHTRELATAREMIALARHKFQQEMRIIVRMDVTLTLLNGLLIVAVTGWAGLLWYQGTASVGAVAAATTLVLRLNNLTYWLMWATTGLVQALGTVQEGMETITQPLSIQDEPTAKPLDWKGGEIRFEGVTHSYGRGAGSGGVRDLTFTLHPGEKLGIVGRSGAGKSTLIKLLLRFYDPEAGRILIDGQDLRDLQQDSLRHRIGVVQQDSSLLHRSVRDNLLYGRPDASEAEMIEAARQAQAHEFIQELSDPEGRRGYDAHVGERGVKLSGGQRQRIALARVILKNAPLLVLDEATSALDSESEAAIQTALYSVMAGKSVIAIAHRLSTLDAMDRLIVLDEGRIIESGTHAELMAQGGLYAALRARQSGGRLRD